MTRLTGGAPAVTERRKERAAFWSIVASVAITLGKGAAGIATGSLALISDAAQSLLDVGATTMTFLAVRAAHKPADEEHHYGHGKFESVAALVETAFLLLLAGAVAYEGTRRLFAGESTLEFSWVAIAVLGASVVIDGWRWYSLGKVARETGSEALAADALHFWADLVNSLFVLAAFAAAALGYPQGDAVAAILVAMVTAIAGVRLAVRTLSTLVDTAPKGLAEQVAGIAREVPGVTAVERVRLRPAGGQVIGEVLVKVSRTLPLERVAAIKQEIIAHLGDRGPAGEFTVTADPVQLDDETILERVMLIAAKQRAAIHHVTVQSLSGRLSVSFDIEVDGRLSLAAAHEIASRLENAIRGELGPQVEVESHIEPLEIDYLHGREADAATVARVAATLAEEAKGVEGVCEVHHVRVRETPRGLVVNYHCRMQASATIARIHEEVDRLERRVRRTHPEILRVISHAEPAADR